MKDSQDTLEFIVFCAEICALGYIYSAFFISYLLNEVFYFVLQSKPLKVNSD